MSNMSIRDIAYTLHAKRSRFAVGTTIAAASPQELIDQLETKLQSLQPAASVGKGMMPGDVTSRSFVTGSKRKGTRIIGIFTGQGAQWARQGWGLIASSSAARRIIDDLDRRLCQLPQEDRPSWSLLGELEKGPESSNIHQASVSQPLTTAIQILQVRLLREAGVEFSVVVGHSSGEIGAAYAAGAISADDAICIAYYRGLVSHLSSGSRGLPGSMVSVSCSAEEIQRLLQDAEVKERVVIAAYNSPRNVTLSGDAEAIRLVMEALQEAKIPAKMLKIDKAYHSHHMTPCSTPYLRALLALDVSVRGSKCPWVSTVTGEPMTGPEDIASLRSSYWKDNMVQPVLFMQALEKVWTTMGPFDLSIELGPHPALRNAVIDTIQGIGQQEARLPHTGVCYRDKNSARSFAEALGYIWASLGADSIDLQAYDRFMVDDNASYSRPCSLAKDLPRYAWDHDTEYWHESRQSASKRTFSVAPHPLLGRREVDDDERDEMRWRHFLRPRDVAWLGGHRLQNQIVFPAAGYVVMAIEALLMVVQQPQRQGLETTDVVEVLGLELARALTFDSDDDTAELVVSLSQLTAAAAVSPDNTATTDARFVCKRAKAKSNVTDAVFEVLATCQVRLHHGPCTAVGALPARENSPRASELAKVDADAFYASLETLGYGYSSPFRGLGHMRRRLGCATGSIVPPPRVGPENYLVHPAALDAAFQSVLLAKSTPGDGEIRSIHVPSAIQRVLLDVRLCAADGNSAVPPLSFEAASLPYTSAIAGDVTVYSTTSPCAMIQVENISLRPLSAPSRQDDKEIFSHVVWGPMSPDARRVASHVVGEEQRQAASLLERLAVYYLRVLDRDYPEGDPCRQQSSSKYLLQFASHVVSQAEAGQLRLWRAEWAHDTYRDVLDACRPLGQLPDFRLLRAVGESLGRIVGGDKSAIEVGLEEGLLREYYLTSLDLSGHTRSLGRVVGQIAHRHPRLDVLEIGAGTGAATKHIFDEVPDGFASYTFTDVSPGFFGPFQDECRRDRRESEELLFKTLDISRELQSQGFEESSCDLVVASFVLHATPCLRATLRHVRHLLRPGGYLVVAEPLPEKTARLGAIFGAFPGWWSGTQEGRVLSPCVSVAEWDRLLQEAGFSGCDTVAPEPDSLVHPATLFVSQAVDDRVSLLRDPMGCPALAQHGLRKECKMQELVLLGGDSPRTRGVAGRLRSLLSRYFQSVKTLRSISELGVAFDLPSTTAMKKTTILSIEDLDRPLMEKPTSDTWKALGGVLSVARGMAWVTHGRLETAPFSNMMVGLLRCAKREHPALSTLSLDFEGAREVDARIIAEALLRFQLQLHWQQEKPDDRTERLVLAEPEIVVRKDGSLEVPRLVPSSAMNRRYNAARRRIMEDVKPHAEDVCVTMTDAGFSLQKRPRSLECSPGSGPGSDHAKVVCSISLPIRVTPSTSMYLAIGQVADSDEYSVSLSPACASIVRLRESISVKTKMGPRSSVSAPDLLRFLTYSIMARSILEGVETGSKILVQDADRLLAEALDLEAAGMAVQVTYTTCSSSAFPPGRCKVIHPRATRRDIARVIPKDVALFIDVSAMASAPSPLGAALDSLLPACCRRKTAQMLFPRVVCAPSCTVQVQEHLARSVNVAESSVLAAAAANVPCSGDTGLVRVVPAGQLSQITLDPQQTPQYIIDWVRDSVIPVQSVPADTLVRFSASKVYWLVGLAKDLGISLCEWMVHNGARHIIISSRRPSIHKAWLESMEDEDARIRIMPCDITDELEVVRVYKEIKAMSLPIGGVAQGATVRQPKVEGSIRLANLFRDETLEFFVFFSSVACVTGNPGQANYAAANMALASLAQQRRRMRLSASVINIGPILGVGYISRETAASRSSSLIQNLVSEGYTMLSERDFHQLFAEAVVAGRPGSPGPFEITTGLATSASSARAQGGNAALPTWAASPILGNFFRQPQESRGGPVANQPGHALPLATRLSLATDMEEARDLISSDLVSELGKFFHMDPASLGGRDLSQVRLDEAGIDSLIASEIRNWFIKTLGFGIPVLKILTVGAVSELVMTAASMLPDSMVPRSVGIHFPTHRRQQQSRPRCRPRSPRSARPFFVREGHGAFFPQELFWVSRQLLVDKTSLNHVASFRVHGPVHAAALDTAVRDMAQRHEPLRSCFFEQDGQAKRRVLRRGIVRLEQRQIGSETEVAGAVAELERHVFDLEAGETVRIQLLCMDSETRYLVMGSHSLVLDGQSFPILVRELGRRYISGDSAAISRGPQQPRPSPEYMEFQSSLDYWKQELADMPETLPVLPFSGSSFRSPLATCGNVRATLRIKSLEKEKIRVLCSQSRATPFHFYLSIFRALLSRYCADTNEKLSIGIADANRSLDDDTDKIGCFMDYRMGQSESVSWGDECQLKLKSFSVRHSMYDVALDVVDDPTGDCTIEVFLRSDLYSQQNADRLASEFGSLATAFVESPQLTFNTPDTLQEAESEQVLAFSRDTIVHRFVDIADDVPWQAAVSDETRVVTYAELSSRVRSVALAIKARHVARGSRVAVLQEPSLEWVSSILAIMWIGAVYVPLDIDSPPERLTKIVHDCQPDLLLVDHSTYQILHAPLSEGSTPQLQVADIVALSDRELLAHLPVPIEATQSDAATILYTSGTTGTPKGIVLEHGGLRNWLESMPERFGLAHGAEVVLQQSAACFDMSLLQVLAGLCTAGRVHVASSRHRRDPEAVARVLAEQGVTCTIATPSEYAAWFEHRGLARSSPSLWRTAIAGGEHGVEALAPSFASLAETRPRPLRLFNAYGPAEATFAATSREVQYQGGRQSSADASAGSPLPNYAVYVLEPGSRRLVPVGVRGEVFIAGPGVAAGYLNNDALTGERFVPSHLATPGDVARGWTTLHRTGDVGRWRADGSLVLEGRVEGDTQVKLRGLRIDLREIEKAIKQKSGGAVAEAVVSVRPPASPNKTQAFLAAHVTLEGARPLRDRQVLFESLTATRLELPQYMCPAVFVVLDRMPYTSNFKLDRKAIAAIPMPTLPGCQTPQLSRAQLRLKTMWEEVIPAEVFDRHTFSPETDFFHVGGTSLLLLRLQALIRDGFGIRLPIPHMYSSSTLGAMAKELEMSTDSDTTMCSPIHVNWDEETAPTANILKYDVPPPGSAPPGDDSRVVVLTGSTGYLGQALLKALVDDPTVHRVHCLAVRNAPGRLLHADGTSSPSKVVMHGGDLRQPRLGLSEADARAVFAAATLVIHGGADVAFQKSYASLRAANLGSTRELARLCLPRRIPFHFVSSASACVFFATATAAAAAMVVAEAGPVSMASWPPPADVREHGGAQGATPPPSGRPRSSSSGCRPATAPGPSGSIGRRTSCGRVARPPLAMSGRRCATTAVCCGPCPSWAGGCGAR
ncbi:uncharacterized protein PG986_010097 [Apiospora aurea]|uniref:Carrier domain-containing protein n=1 Tax=Apiospora aurea TaxID=335848 RepID=A0ABR1QAT0_9PEZI